MSVDRLMLIHAIVGCGFGTWRFAEEMTQRGLARFTGNQWNEDWEWERGGLERLSDQELEELYERLK